MSAPGCVREAGVRSEFAGDLASCKKREYNCNKCLNPSPTPAGAPVTFLGRLVKSPAVSLTYLTLSDVHARCLRVVVESTLSAVHPMHRVMQTMPPRLRGAYP